MIVSIILLALGMVAASVFITSKVINYSLKTIIFKTVASTFFVALGAYLFVYIPGHFLFKLFVLLGLIFGLLGDVFLGFKYITAKTKKLWILLGLFVFSFGHICYIAGVFVEYYIPGNVLYLILPFITALVIGAIYMFVASKMGVKFGGSMLPFAIYYLFCLTTMVSSAFYMALLHKFNIINVILFFVGAVCFGVSDFMLTGAYFKKGQRSKTYMAVYSIFYYIAQFMIAFSIFFLSI